MLRNRIACDDDKAHPFQTVTSPYCQLSLQIFPVLRDLPGEQQYFCQQQTQPEFTLT
jgi:hypothetical protein